MKVFICILAVIVTLATVNGHGYGYASGGGAYGGPSGGVAGSGSSSYGGASGASGSVNGGGHGINGGGAVAIPAPACPKNYLFSCQPSLAPVPCSAPSASQIPPGGYSSVGFGSAGAYSENVPTIIAAPYGYPRIPQNFYPLSSYYGNY